MSSKKKKTGGALVAKYRTKLASAGPKKTDFAGNGANEPNSIKNQPD